MFFRVEATVRAGHTNPACTSNLCVWDVPQTKTAGESLRVKDMDFNATKFNKGSNNNNNNSLFWHGNLIRCYIINNDEFKLIEY